MSQNDNLSFGQEVVELRYEKCGQDKFCIQAVCNKLSSLAGFDIQSDADDWVVVISAFDKSDMSLKDIARHFSNELIDQNLREIVAKRTEAERTLVLSYAFSNTKLIDG